MGRAPLNVRPVYSKPGLTELTSRRTVPPVRTALLVYLYAATLNTITTLIGADEHTPQRCGTCYSLKRRAGIFCAQISVTGKTYILYRILIVVILTGLPIVEHVHLLPDPGLSLRHAARILVTAKYCPAEIRLIPYSVVRIPGLVESFCKELLLQQTLALFIAVHCGIDIEIAHIRIQAQTAVIYGLCLLRLFFSVAKFHPWASLVVKRLASLALYYLARFLAKEPQIFGTHSRPLGSSKRPSAPYPPCTDTLRVFVPLLYCSCACTLLSCPDGRVHICYLHEMLRILYFIYWNVKYETLKRM